MSISFLTEMRLRRPLFEPPLYKEKEKPQKSLDYFRNSLPGLFFTGLLVLCGRVLS
jgi:hypothetical protein